MRTARCVAMVVLCGGLCASSSGQKGDQWQLKHDVSDPLLDQPQVESDGLTKGDYNSVRSKAEKGDAQSQYVLGMAFIKGTASREKDVAKGLHWLRKAAGNDNADAQGMLGMFLLQGKYMGKNEKEGIKLLIQASKNGNEDALELLKDLGIAKEKTTTTPKADKEN